MTISLTILAITFAAAGSLLFSTLTYSLRDYSRTRLAEHLERRGLASWLDKTVAAEGDLTFVTAIARLLANLLVFVAVLHLVKRWSMSEYVQDLATIGLTGLITIVSSVAIPHALANNAAAAIIASQVRLLHTLNAMMRPIAKIMHGIDSIAAQLLRLGQVRAPDTAEQEMQDEILSVVEEGTKEGTVNAQERDMIESVIEFGAVQVSAAMTAVSKIVSLPIDASLERIRDELERSGHSRLPIFEGSLDHVVGILYARDLLKLVGKSDVTISLRDMLRPAFFVPETKPLRDMLADFKRQKVHMAIVLDEYGGTAGLLTIEDVLEQLVGDITDEHEPMMPSLIRKLDEQTFEADGRASIEDINTSLHLDLPEDGGYETIGGFVSNTLGRIPTAGTKIDHGRAAITVIEAEPQRVSRVRIELIPTQTV